MSRAELARDLGLTGQAIGYYESGDRRPDMSVLLRMADVLEQPVSFFLRSSQSFDGVRGTRFFRSIGTRSNKVNNALDVKTKWLWEIVGFVSEHIKLPPVNLPDIPAPVNADGYTTDEIDAIATLVRRHWNLGDGPLANVIALFETHGIVVTRFELGSEEIDAFSCWIKQRPYILLGSEKKSASRSRFDAAHELGHLLLHRHVGQEDLEDKKIRDLIESEANMFAGSFLLPKASLLREFYSSRMKHLEGLKERWRVSIQAIAHRAKQIGIIDDHQYILFRKQISFNRWHRNEPLDDVIPMEQPQWLLKCWQLLTERKIVREAGLEDELGFSLDLVVKLFGRGDFKPRSDDPPKGFRVLK
ncbi:MAG: ImmA/IrrE family metallo-endopeptidase [Pseudolabrys sp.]|nr:ImmA/IrrE family metallo-endopeptidase [Pseudolabrys sp.]